MSARFGGDWRSRLKAAQDATELQRKALFIKTKDPAKLAGRQSIDESLKKGSTQEPVTWTAGCVAASESLRLLRIDGALGPPVPLNRPTLRLVDTFLNCVATQTSAVMLQWPCTSRDAALLHPLGMLSVLGATAAANVSGKGLRTLYFPWRPGSTGSDQRFLLVQRHEILNWNSTHLTRHYNHNGGEGAFGLLYETFGHLSLLAGRDTSKPHLAHPTLSECYPLLTTDIGVHAELWRPSGDLFGRVAHGAGLGDLVDHRPQLCAPGSAPFALYGIAAGVSPRRALASACLTSFNGTSPDICVLDLCEAALRSLGRTWEKTLEVFLKELHAHHPSVPCIAVTGDTFVFNRATAIMKPMLRGNSAAGSVILRRTIDPLSDDPPIRDLTNLTLEFHTVGGPAQAALAELSVAAKGADDATLSAILWRRMGRLRRAMSLPFGINTAYSALTEELGQAQAEAYLESRSCSSVLAPIQDALESELAGPQRARLERAKVAIQNAFDALADETPIGSLLVDIATPLSRKSSRTIIAFQSNEDRVLGRRRLCQETDEGRALKRKIDKGQLLLADASDLSGQLATVESSKESHHWKRLLVVAPTLDWLSRILLERWLPEQLIVLCDQSLAARIAQTFQRLGAHRDLSGPNRLGGRLLRTANAAAQELKKRRVQPVDLELDPTRSLKPNNEIDLVDDVVDDESEIVVLTLASGRKLRARAASTLVQFSRDASVNPFDRVTASEVGIGKTIVVPDQAFIDEARQVLPIQVLAYSWVNVYHAAIEAMLPAVQGDDNRKKARALLKALKSNGAKTVDETTVADWLNVKEHRKLPPDRLRPHAPQNKREFRALMSVIGVPEASAEKMWFEGIQPLRIDRRRAGMKLGSAFISVLVDPHGAASGLSSSVREGINELRQRALDHMDDVVQREVVSSRN